MGKYYFQEHFGDTSPVARIAQAHEMPEEIALAVADYYIHGRLVPSRLIEDARVAENVIGDYDRMVGVIRDYAGEFKLRHRVINYKPNGPGPVAERRSLP